MAKIISIHSYRGGTGKSNLTANLVTAIALAGKRVAIIDTDIQSPGIHNIFDLNATTINKTLNDYLWGNIPIEDTVYDVSTTAGVNDKGKIFLIPSSSNVDAISRILSEGYNVNLLNQSCRQLIQSLQLDYLFIDTHPGLSKEVFLSIAISHILIIILRPDRQDYQGTAVTVDLAKQLMVPQMMLLINKVVSGINLDNLKQQIENTYQTKVGGIFPATEEMMRLGSNGIFCQLYPHHPWTNTLFQVANQIINNQLDQQNYLHNL